MEESSPPGQRSTTDTESEVKVKYSLKSGLETHQRRTDVFQLLSLLFFTFIPPSFVPCLRLTLLLPRRLSAL